jgi:tRNA pseudouridine13 synthase
LAGNQFRITLREVTADRAALIERLERIAEIGVPNYFGEQRFGHDGQNLNAALRLRDERNNRKPRGRNRGRAPQRGGKQGIYLSAARSYLFNHVLSQRVADKTWREVLPGDVRADPEQQTVKLPTGPLWGRGRLATQEDTAALEQRVLEPHQPYCDLLEHKGLVQERRALVLKPVEFAWTFPDSNSLELSFQLPAGTFATAVLRELIAYQ